MGHPPEREARESVRRFKLIGNSKVLRRTGRGIPSFEKARRVQTKGWGGWLTLSPGFGEGWDMSHKSTQRAGPPFRKVYIAAAALFALFEGCAPRTSTPRSCISNARPCSRICARTASTKSGLMRAGVQPYLMNEGGKARVGTQGVEKRIDV